MWEQLLAAIAKGDLVIVEKLINSMSQLDFNKDCRELSYNQIPLHYAIYLRHEAIVDKLLAARPELVSVIDKNGKNALDMAVNTLNNHSIVDKVLAVIHNILTVGSSVVAIDHEQKHSATKREDKREISKLIKVELILATVAAKNSITEVIMNNTSTKELFGNQEAKLKSAIKKIDEARKSLEAKLTLASTSLEDEVRDLEMLLSSNDKKNYDKSFIINEYSNEEIIEFLGAQLLGLTGTDQ